MGNGAGRDEGPRRAPGFDTQAIHAGWDGKHALGALNPPLYQTTSFVFDSVSHAQEVFSGESAEYVYTRGNNPTLRLFERKMAILEKGEKAVAFSSGMAAISSVLLSFLEAGDEVLTSRTIYGSTYHLLTQLLPRYSVKTRFANLASPGAVRAALTEATKVVYIETPANPSLELVDIREASMAAHEVGAVVVVDNTFATPYFQNPLALGADVVVHSCTKYIGGHGDALGGVAVARDPDYILRLRFEFLCDLGSVLSPFNAWLFLRGLKTLGVRMERHASNALVVARFLSDHPKVERVSYPGLDGFPQRDLARRQMRGYGGVVSFEVRGGYEAAVRFIDRLRLTTIAVSLGDAETLVEHPASMTHREYPRERLPEFGFSEALVRLSVGLEDPEDIIDDLDHALRRT
ncbi:MAG: aminotransferase class I/II-fold pyridoxal phosphate-dependent enzyme [Firmicutes bacterium]|jgi:methionine-gamma-lyase|nr:aminotransferase class I/II-fold pyridoxal phosphate-dependent enzyme [Bacillota bacterium]MDH7496682.1 aminotransferase class I/II-fold pyridoxal phosphate-dependent enzyme [Bacillota bacterium]